MSKKILNTMLCVISITTGGMIYLVFRENTYIARYIDRFIDLEGIRNSFSCFDCRVIRHYVPDFLWAFSLNCGLNLLIDSLWLNAIISFFCGTAWELLQYLNVVSGTGDIIDITAYLTACVLAVTINYFSFKEKRS